MRQAPVLVCCALMTWAGPAAGQGTPALQPAEQAYQALDYGTVVVEVRRALAQRLERRDQVRAYELLGFSYGALDSTRQGVDAFREMIFLDPDHELDPVRVSPRIISLFASALGQVLVVRKVQLDSVSFVAGQGAASLRFEVTRLARVTVRAVSGQSETVVAESQNVAGESRVEWRALNESGGPLPPGRYQLLIEATAGREQFASRATVEVSHSPVDTLPHLTQLPGYTPQPEVETPARNWRPLGIATLYTGFAAGASLALHNTALGQSSREEVGAVSFAVLVTGLIMSLKKPDTRPLPSGILYNRLLKEQLARQNADIALDNAARLRQVRVSVKPVPGGGR